jgi:hypothetical protein
MGATGIAGVPVGVGVGRAAAGGDGMDAQAATKTAVMISRVVLLWELVILSLWFCRYGVATG